MNILSVLFAQAGDEFFNSMETVAHLAQAVYFAAAAEFGDRDGDGFFMDIKADLD